MSSLLLLLPPPPPPAFFFATANASLDYDYDIGNRSVSEDAWNSTGRQEPASAVPTMAQGDVGRQASKGGGGGVVQAAAEELEWVFFIHTIGFACIYFLLAFYAFFSILNLRSLISSRPYMSTINGFLCLLGSSRAACLFIDPYNLRESMPKAIRSLLWDVGFPCLTSAFCLIQLAFLQLTQSGQLVPQHRLCQLSPSTTVYIVSPWTRAKKYVLNLGPEKLRRKSCLSLVITAHFTCLITTDVAATFHDQLAVGKLIVQVVFLLWGSFLSATFLYGGYKVMQLLKHGVPRRAGSSGASSTGGGCAGRLLPSDGSRGPISPPPFSDHDGPPLMLTIEEARAREAESQHKGIMQLALLAPLGVGVAGGGSGLASSLSLLPRALISSAPPKIRITDEHERTFSLASSAGPTSAAATPATPATPLPPPRPRSAPYDNGHEGDEEDCSSSDNESVRISTSPSVVARVRTRSIGCKRESNTVSPSRMSSAIPSPQRKKSLTWRESSSGTRSGDKCAAVDPEEAREEESSLLPPHVPVCSSPNTPAAVIDADFTLQAILGHLKRSKDERDVEHGGKKGKGKRGSEGVGSEGEWAGGCIGAVGRSRGQVSRVLRVTYVAAVCCAAICLLDGGRLYAAHAGPSETIRGEGPPSERPSPWPWFCLQTLSRALEIAMAIAMANVTKTPVHRYHHHNFEPESHQNQQHHQPSYSFRPKQREALYM